jgi:serine/threonine protein kinase
LLSENDLDLAKTAGSPAFFAPELCTFDPDKRPIITKAIDVWALGITFYCLLFGREPFPGVYGEMELYEKICHVPIEPPLSPAIDHDTKDLLKRFLTKDPLKRIKLYQVRRHPFITKGIQNPKEWAEGTDLTKTSTPLQVTPHEVETAVTSFRNIFRRTLNSVKMTAKRSMSYLRPKHGSGRVHSGITSPNPSTTIPGSFNGQSLNTDVPLRQSPKSDTTDVRPRMQHAYFQSFKPEIPPTPPHSGKLARTVPKRSPSGRKGNGVSNGISHNGKTENVSKCIPSTPLTPPPVTSIVHLNDDYSNLYYSDEDFEFEESDSESDDGDRLEMKFGGKGAK